jgi:hypothetical protein
LEVDAPLSYVNEVSTQSDLNYCTGTLIDMELFRHSLDDVAKRQDSYKLLAAKKAAKTFAEISELNRSTLEKTHSSYSVVQEIEPNSMSSKSKRNIDLMRPKLEQMAKEAQHYWHY